MPLPTFGLLNPERLDAVVSDELVQLNAALQTAFQQMGRATEVPFNAANFLGNSAMTFTVAAADAPIYTYAVIGKLMLVTFNVTGTVGGTPSAAILFRIPERRVLRYSGGSSIFVFDAGVRGAGDCLYTQGQINLAIQRRDAAVFTAGSVTVIGQVWIEVV